MYVYVFLVGKMLMVHKTVLSVYADRESLACNAATLFNYLMPKSGKIYFLKRKMNLFSRDVSYVLTTMLLIQSKKNKKRKKRKF